MDRPPPPLPDQSPRVSSLPSAPVISSPPIATPSPAPSSAAKLSNRYVRRLTASDRACWVCSRPTPICLVSTTAGAEDFFWCCISHLGDRHFATLLQTGATTPSPAAAAADNVRLPDKVGQDEIDKIKKEYEEKQKAKKDKKKEESDASAEGQDKDKKKEEQGWLAYLKSSLVDVASPASSPTPATPVTAAATTPAATPKGHEYYQLHRSFYSMRVEAQNKKLAMKRAKELNFPSVPRG